MTSEVRGPVYSKASILYLILLAITFYSCENKDDTLFEKTAEERLTEALTKYQSTLIDAPYGWNAVIYPGGGGSYGFYFKFTDKNRVAMYSDFKDASGATSKESSYRLTALQTPVLIFDTYSYLHVLADPDEDVNGGIRGLGLASDFEFTIFDDSVKTDRIALVGRKNNSRLILTRATQEQATSYANGGLADALAFNNISKYLAYFKRVTISGESYELSVNQNARLLQMTWLSGNTAKSHTTEYYFTGTGLTFDKPLVNGSTTITGFTNITWNASATQLKITANGSTGTVVEAIKPLVVDVDAPRAWWTETIESGGDWRTVDGFHVNGVDDAFGLKSLTQSGNEYWFYVYQPAYTTSNDLFAPVFYADGKATYYYADAPRKPTFTSDGRAIFSSSGTYGTVPTSGPSFNTKNQLYDSNGYYLIKTSATTYDMVSAKDAKTWISWQ